MIKTYLEMAYCVEGKLIVRPEKAVISARAEE